MALVMEEGGHEIIAVCRKFQPPPIKTKIEQARLLISQNGDRPIVADPGIVQRHCNHRHVLGQIGEKIV